MCQLFCDFNMVQIQAGYDCIQIITQLCIHKSNIQWLLCDSCHIVELSQ